MPRRDYSGNAKPGILTGTVSATDLTIPFDDATGWPSGGAAGKFFITINSGQSNEERVLVASRTGTTLTVAAVGDRGVDDTVASIHTAGETVEHTFSAVDADDSNAHVFDATRDDHSQYMKADGTRHDLAARHTFGAALGTPPAPEPVGAVAAAGAGAAPSRQDHVHILGTGSVFLSNMFVAGVVDAAAIGANAVTTAKIIDNAVTTAKVLDQAITAAKIALASITGAQLAAGAINASNLFGAGVVDVLALASNSVSTGKVVDASITQAKVALEAPQSYVPVFGGLTGASNTRTGSYFKFGGLVLGIAQFIIGAGGDVNAPLTVTLPTTCRTPGNDWFMAGRALQGTDGATGLGIIEAGDTVGKNIRTIGVGVWDATSPFNWTVGGTCLFAFCYASAT